MVCGAIGGILVGNEVEWTDLPGVRSSPSLVLEVTTPAAR